MKAYLYWSYLDDGPTSSERSLTFAGTRIVGREIGSGADTCWLRSRSRSFRADVTSLIPGNGTYSIANIAAGGSLLAQGASLVVVYSHPREAQRTVVILDGNDVVRIDDGNWGPPTMLRQANTIRGFTAGASTTGLRAMTTYIVGDGQAFEERVSFSAGDGTRVFPNSIDGSDGALWDTDTHDVSDQVAIGDTSATVELLINPDRSWDCLNWVAQAFSVTTSTRLPVPEFKQTDPSWAGDTYDSATDETWCGTTMAQCGCYTTSVAMMLAYYGVTRAPDGRATTPATLNEYLTKHNGYIYGMLSPDGVERYTKAANAAYGTPIIQYLGRTERHDASLISQDLNDGRPVILREQLASGTHFIVATGQLGDTFSINDPFFDRQTLSDYSNTSTGLRRYRTTETDLSSITVAVPSPAEILVTDPDGNRTGFDAEALVPRMEIPGSEYYLEDAIEDPTGTRESPPSGAGVQFVYIAEPKPGSYDVELVSAAGEEFDMTIVADDRDGQPATRVFSGVSTSGRSAFNLSYTPVPGSTTLRLEQPPAAHDVTVDTTEDTEAIVGLQGSDPNEDDLVFAIVDPPRLGTLGPVTQVSANSAQVTYSPDPDRTGVDSFRYRANDGRADSNTATAIITITPAGHTVGVVDVSQGRWHLRNSAGEVTSFLFGNPRDIPFSGDWDCDGDETPGLFRTLDAFIYLSNANRSQIADIRFFFGNRDDVPLAGDFDGDGCDTVSIYRPSEQLFYIINELGESGQGLGRADFAFSFGNPGDTPVVGDWDNDGVDEIGLHREATGLFYWRNTLTAGVADGELLFGNPGDRFVAGDWGIVDERDTPAVFRPSNATFFLRHTLSEGVADTTFSFGEGPWMPVAGDFGID